MCLEVAYLYDSAVRADVPARWAEVRHWLDGLALTPKGKRDCRLRLDESADPRAESEADDSTRYLAEYNARLARMDDHAVTDARTRFAKLRLTADGTEGRN